MTGEIRGFIDDAIRGPRPPSYSKLRELIREKSGVLVSKATISKRAKNLGLKLRRGRKRFLPVDKGPAHSVFLDCAGAFFLKGAELEIGLLDTVNQLLKMSTESHRARKALKLAQQINAVLLYAPLFGLNTVREIARYSRRGLLYLAEQKDIPQEQEIEQYLHFLVGRRMLPFIIKEVAKRCTEALFVRIDFDKKMFHLDAQGHTVWPSPKIPEYFSATINKSRAYVEDVFCAPSAQRPLILQTCPGYNYLPPEAFNLIQCFEQAQEEPITRIAVAEKTGKTLAAWRELSPRQKYFFLAGLNPWQYARLSGTKVIKDFKQYLIGPEKEAMAIAEARVNLFNPQLSESIGVRAALVRRKHERLALITNISPREERYIRKIADMYFWRWPDKERKTYYDLMEEAHQDSLERSHIASFPVSLLPLSYTKNPLDGFRLLLEHLHRYALSHFFSSEYGEQELASMGEKFYRQSGYLKIKRSCHQVFLLPFNEQKRQKEAQKSCQKFNQSGIEFADQRRLQIYLQ